MEDNKYYIPSIEEFHVGFKHEQKLVPYDTNYKSKVFGTGDDMSTTFELLKLEPNRIRVKYLDKEDIENLGFITEFKDVDYPILYTKNNYNLIHYKNDNKILIDNGIRRLFDGIIKNKSELIQVLKMIGINE